VTRVGPAFARLGPGASTAATRSSGAGGFPRDLVRDGWQAAGSSPRRCSAGCPPVPDAAAGGYADGGIRADAGGGKRMAAGKGRDDPEAGSSMCITPHAMHRDRRGRTIRRVRRPGPKTARCWPCPHPASRPPQPGQDKPPSSIIRSTRPASLPTVSTGAPLHPHAALPEASAKDHGRAAPEPTRSRCRRAPLPATGTRAKPARLPSMTPISPGTLTVSVACSLGVQNGHQGRHRETCR
jgi:hypothetical protein